MKDRSHLIKKQITDSRGRRTTVWVRPNEQATPKEKKYIEEINKLSTELYEKVKRRGPNEGEEVKLNKAEVGEVLTKGIVGFISAGRNPQIEEDKALSDFQIEQRDIELRKDLIKAGFVFDRVHGKYGEEEDSFMVLVNEVSAHDLSVLGAKYNQDSVIHSQAGKNRMIFTTGENAGKHHAGKGWQEVPKADNFYSEIETPEGSFKFVLDINFDKIKKAVLKFFGLGIK